jgi:hypothetical protein
MPVLRHWPVAFPSTGWGSVAVARMMAFLMVAPERSCQ